MVFSARSVTVYANDMATSKSSCSTLRTSSSMLCARISSFSSLCCFKRFSFIIWLDFGFISLVKSFIFIFCSSQRGTKLSKWLWISFLKSFYSNLTSTWTSFLLSGLWIRWASWRRSFKLIVFFYISLSFKCCFSMLSVCYCWSFNGWVAFDS